MRRPAPPAVMALSGLILLVRFVPAVLWRRLKRRVTRWLAVPPIALALLSCAPSQPATAAETHPVAVVAYEGAVRAWLWLDGQLSGQLASVSDAVTESIAARKEAFVEQCGVERAADCQLAEWDAIIQQWMIEKDYMERVERLERARVALELVRETLSKPPGSDVPGATRRAADALDVLLQELSADGVKIPEPVMAAPSLLRRLQ